MATFTIKPMYGAKLNTAPRILQADLGDGYKQRAADGINAMPEKWSLIWTKKIADIDTIEDFFIARGGHESFDWIPPRHVATKKFICPSWNRSIDSPEGDTITATFEQVFEY